MKKDEKNDGSTGRAVCTTRSLAVASASARKKETYGLSPRRSARGTSSTKLATPTSSATKLERRTPSPFSVSKKSGKMEKKRKASPLKMSNKGNNVSSDKPGGNVNADTSSSDAVESKGKAMGDVEDLTGEVKRYEAKMTGRSYRALYRGHLKSEANASPNDDELVVVGCSRRVPAGNDDARDGNSSTHVNSESKGLLVAVRLARDTENMVLDSSPVVGDDSVIGSASENPETQKLRVSETGVQTDIGLTLKRKRDIEPVQELDHLAQELGHVSNRDYGEDRHNTRQDKSYDPKLSSVYPEYWVPVQLSDVQIEQYCRTLFSKSISLSSLSRIDHGGALEETLASVRKTCDHPYVMDAHLKQLLNKNLDLHELVDVEVKASGKLHLLDAMLTEIKTKGLKAVVFYQAIQSPEGLLLANILDDFVGQRFGQNSYEHGVCHSTKSAINNFNMERECFILLLETRACSQSIKLLRAEALILFGSSLNTSHDIRLLEKIKIESYSERTKIFRLYSVFTVEEKALILARQKKSLDNLSRPLTHALLMWGASYLFDKLDHLHGSQTPDSGVPLEKSIRGDVIREFSSILSSSVGEGNVGKLCLLLEAKHAQGTYSTESTLFGEKYVELSDEVSPNIFWAKLLDGKNPMWKYYSDTLQRSRKRIRHRQVSEATAKLDDGKNTKKKKKASDYDERKASGKDHRGDLESPKVTLQPSCGSASGTNDAFSGKDAIGLYSEGGHISGIPEDMFAGTDWRQTPGESQKSLHAVLKPQIAKLCQVLHLSENLARMIEKFLEYIIENHRVCKEPATTLQAFQIALIWIAVSFVKQKFNREESLIRAKSELGFTCSREEVDYIYSFLYCMKSLFVGRTQGFEEKGEECMAEKRGSHYSSVAKDVEKTISDIKKKCSKSLHKLVQTLEEQKIDLMNRNADKKQELQNCKKVEESFIRVTYLGISTQTLHDDLQRLESTFERKFDALKGELDECLESLEKIYEAAKKKLAEDEACWISRIEKWALTEFRNGAPIQSGNNKHVSGLCSPSNSKVAPDVQTYNDSSGEATYAETNCMASKGSQVPEAETTLGTMLGGSTQQVHEMVASRNDCVLDVSSLSHEQRKDNVATTSQPNEHPSITAPEILNPAGCQEEFAAMNVQLSEYQIRDQVRSATPDEDEVPDSASLDSSLNGEEALISVENDGTIQAGSDKDKVLDQQSEEACSHDKEIPDELPLPHAASLVKTRVSAESDQVDHEICHMPSSPGGKQPDPTENFQGQNIESATEAQPAGSPMPSSPGGKHSDPAVNIQGKNIETTIEPEPAESSSPGGKQSDTAVNIQGKNIEAAIEPEPADSSMPSSPAGQQSDTTANSQRKNSETAIELQPAESSMPSSPARGLSDSAANSQGKNNETSIEPQPDGSSIPSSLARGLSDSAANSQGKNSETAIEPQPDGSPVPSPPDGQQSDPAAIIQSKNIETALEPQPAGSPAPAGQQSDPAVNIQDKNIETAIEPQPGGQQQPDPAEKTQCKNIEATVESQPAGPETLETGGFSASEQADQVACPLPSSSDGNQPDSGTNIESQNISTSVEPHIAGIGAVSDQEIMEAQDPCSPPSPSVGTQADIAANTEGQNTTTASDAVETDNVAPLVHEGVVESSAGVTAHVPSLLNNATATTGQSPIQPIPQIPFPVFSDPFQHELEKLRRQSEITKNICEEKKSISKAKLERRIAELREEYQRKFHEVQAEHAAKKTKLQARKNLVIMNKLLTSAFLSKCTNRISSHSSAAPMGRIQQLAQRATQVSAQRNHTASAPSVSHPSELPLTSTYCTMPRPRQPLISKTSTYSTVLFQQQEQQQNLGSGLQRSNDVVCLSDDE